MNITTSILTSLTLTTLTAAQTQTLRGSVEDVSGTSNQFFLDCTNLRVTSSVLNLNTIISNEMIFQVVDISTPGNPLLDIRSATPTTKVFDMGNLRINQSARWEVNAPAGSLAYVFLDFTSNTGYHPLGVFGTFLLGSNAVTLRSGVTNGQNQFEFNFTPPASATPFLGTSFTGQALVGDHGTWFLSNPDCKVVEAR